MLKLLIVADDFTGALDSGVQFASCGADTKVITNPNYDFTRSESNNVLVFDSETRHIKPDDAYRIVYEFVKRAKDFGIPYIYKKTDSGLRGNIGSELAGAMDALGLDDMHFIPAFPAMRRTTKNHIHYINGVPVAQSMFGEDPFEPVKNSDVYDIIRAQTEKKISVHDAETDGDMIAIAGELGHDGLRLTAGCAGFAGVLAHVLGYHGKPAKIPDMPKRFFLVCGSVNPVTRKQIEYARSKGFKYICLNTEQKLNPDWPGSNKCKLSASKWVYDLSDKHAILDANDPDEDSITNEYIKSHALTIDDVRLNISRSVTGAAKAMLDAGLDARLICVGGDTLLALMNAVNVHELVPFCEISQGVVLTSFEYNGKNYYIMTKSGGFGEEDLLLKLAEK